MAFWYPSRVTAEMLPCRSRYACAYSRTFDARPGLLLTSSSCSASASSCSRHRASSRRARFLPVEPEAVQAIEVIFVMRRRQPSSSISSSWSRHAPLRFMTEPAVYLFNVKAFLRVPSRCLRRYQIGTA